MCHELWIDRNDGRGYRQLFFELNQWPKIQRLMLEGIDKGWRMQYIPACPAEDTKKAQG